MKLVFYLLKKFFLVFLASMLFFVLVLCLTDLLLNIWGYISRNAPAKVILKISLYYVPKAVWYSVPVAVLFAVSYTLSSLYSRNELLAIFASGISLLRFSFPLFIVSILMSFGMFFFEDKVVVPTYSKKVSMQKAYMNISNAKNSDKIVIMAEEGNIIYKADFYDDNVRRLYSLYVMFRDKNKNFQSLVYADSASWQNDHWMLSSPFEYKVKNDEVLPVPFEADLSLRLVEPPETFRNNVISVEEVTAKEAREYIEHLEKAGLPSAEAKSVYYKKYSFPFVVCIVVFLAVGLSGKTKKNILLVSLASCASSVVLFYITQMLTMLMAKFGALPPLLGAWSPVVLFIFLSGVLLHYART